MVERLQKKADETDDEYSQQHETITSVSRIGMLLRPLMEKHTIITATLPDCNKFFNTAFLSIDADNGLITIDGLHPKEGHALFLKSRKVTLHTTYEGSEVNFTTNLKKSDTADNMDFYIVNFPDSIRYLQRRSAFRVPVSAAKEIKIELETGNKLYNGELNDISAGGMCIRFTKIKELNLIDKSEPIKCCIHLPGKQKLRCAFRICHSIYDKSRNCLFIGGSFINLDKIQHRVIDRFVVELQRHARKSITR